LIHFYKRFAIMMDVLSQQRAVFEVKQSNSLVLFPNSISIQPYPANDAEHFAAQHPLSTHKVAIDIQYATTTFSLLVTMDQPLDFIITTPNLLPMKYLDDSLPPAYPDTRLVDLIRWILRQLRNYMIESIKEKEKLADLSLALENLVAMGAVGEDMYEVVLVGDKAIVLVKFMPEKDIEFSSLKELVKENKLLNTGGHFFVFKMGFSMESGAFLPGEFAISFSSDLKNMFPELSNYPPSALNVHLANDLVALIMHVKDTVNKTIADAVEGWEARARMFLKMLSVFENGEIAIPFVDSDTMSTMDLAFRTEASKVVLKTELSSRYPAELPRLTVHEKKILTQGSRETRGSGEIHSHEVDLGDWGYEENNEESFVEVVMQVMAQFCQS